MWFAFENLNGKDLQVTSNLDYKAAWLWSKTGQPDNFHKHYIYFITMKIISHNIVLQENHCYFSLPLLGNIGANIPYFLDYKMQFPQQIWEENGGASYSANVAYLALWGGGGTAVEQGFFFPYFPPLKPRYVLWSGVSYSPKIW